MPTSDPRTAFDFDRTGPMTEPAAYDALTDLFLGDTPAPSRAAEALPFSAAVPSATAALLPSARASLEVLVMGHLPVRTSPWAAQYARAAAEELGTPAALVRLNDATLSVEVYGLAPSQRESHGCDTAAEAIEHAKSLGAAWIVQGDEAEAGSITGARRVTLLCAGNEAAVVAAFQTLKSLAAALPEGPSSPEIRVCVMGAAGDAAESISRRLRDAAQMFLKRRVGAGPNVSRMGPTGAAPVFRGACDLKMDQLVALLRAPMRARAVAGDAVASASMPSVPRPSVSGPTIASRIEAVAASDAAAALAEPASATTPAPSSPTQAATLASRVEGLAPLPFRCPDEPRVEFARDASGSLHVLCAADRGDAVRGLTSAAAWAAKNADLLSMVSPGLRSGAPVLHLFTAEPARWRPMLDSSVRLHLLASVQVEGKTGWCCVALN